MTEETTNLQIEVRVGNADQREVGLTANEPVEPFTVGAAGSWKVQADGVAKVHAYLFFDGATLFLSSPDPLNPAYANGQPVGTEWVAVGPGSEISFGEALLTVEGEVFEILDADPDPETTNLATKKPEKPSIAFPTTDEATILRPVHKDGVPPPAERPVHRDGVPPPAPRPGSVSAPASKPKKLKIRQSARENPTADDDATRFAPLDVGAPVIRPIPGSIGGEGALPPSASSPPPAPRAWAPPGVAPTGPSSPAVVPSGPPSPGFAPAASSPGVVPSGPPSPGFAPAPSPGAVPSGPPSPGFAPAPSPGAVPSGPPSPGFAPPPSPGVVPSGPPSPGFAPAPSPGAVPGGPPSPGFAPAGPSSPGFAPAASSPGVVPSGPPSPGFAPAGPSSPGFAPGGPPAGFFADPRQETTKNTDKPVKKNPAQVLLEQWKSASIPQKAIIALMPLAFAAMFVVFDDGEDDAQPAPRTKPTASASSAAPEKAPPVDDHAQADANVETSTDPPAAETAEPDPPPKLAKGEKTKQRLAADALAAGNDAEALRLYEALVQEYPDEAAYKDVVRILKARKSGK